MTISYFDFQIEIHDWVILIFISEHHVWPQTIHSVPVHYFKFSFFNHYYLRFLSTLRGHVQRVYQVAWSADSRLLCSGSADSTLKVWDITKRKLMCDLPGHADEVSYWLWPSLSCAETKKCVLLIIKALEKYLRYCSKLHSLIIQRPSSIFAA